MNGPNVPGMPFDPNALPPEDDAAARMNAVPPANSGNGTLDVVGAGLEAVEAGAELVGSAAEAIGEVAGNAVEAAGGVLEGAGGCLEGCSCSLVILLFLVLGAGSAMAFVFGG